MTPLRTCEGLIKCDQTDCAHWSCSYCTSEVPADGLTGDRNCLHRVLGTPGASSNMVLPMSMAVGNCVVTTIPSNRENVALENAKGQGIPVTVVDKRGFLVRVQIRHMARWHLGFFRTSSTESMRFYPMADGTVGWEDKRQLDLFSEGAGT